MQLKVGMLTAEVFKTFLHENHLKDFGSALQGVLYLFVPTKRGVGWRARSPSLGSTLRRLLFMKRTNSPNFHQYVDR